MLRRLSPLILIIGILAMAAAECNPLTPTKEVDKQAAITSTTMATTESQVAPPTMSPYRVE